MLVNLPTDPEALAESLVPFVELVGRDRWTKRLAHLNAEMNASPFRWKIVADYHWLEVAIEHLLGMMASQNRIQTDKLILTALKFAATTVEVHARLSKKGKQLLEGRLRDALKADNGFAPVYLELDLAQRLMDEGYDVEFSDIEGTGQFDLLFEKGAFVGEVECKSQSVDAGRQIHRKDFYRFIETISPALQEQLKVKRRELLVITLKARLSPNMANQAALRRVVTAMLASGGPHKMNGQGFHVERRSFDDAFPEFDLASPGNFHSLCKTAFGQDVHAAGAVTEDGGCMVVMLSLKEDDTSKPMLEALRKAATQFSGKRPSFIAIQEHGIEAADLMLRHVRRRAGILSHALFFHYGAAHVNGVSVSAFGAVVEHDGRVGSPSFGIPNSKPKFPVNAEDAAPFLLSITDQEFSDIIGAPLPSPNISRFTFGDDDVVDAG